MRVRLIDSHDVEWYSGQFNVHALSEVIIQSSEHGADSCYIKDLEVFIEKLQEWKSMSHAFRDRDIINDNYNTVFFEPQNQEDRERGYTL